MKKKSKKTPKKTSKAKKAPRAALGRSLLELGRNLAKVDRLFGEKNKPPFSRDARQKAVASWCANTFGPSEAESLPQRGIRLIEEAVEAAQAAGTTRADADRVVAHVFGRPAGELRQELGGVGVTLLALAAAAGENADSAEFDEVERILAVPADHFRKRNHEKNTAGLRAEGLVVTGWNETGEDHDVRVEPEAVIAVPEGVAREWTVNATVAGSKHVGTFTATTGDKAIDLALASDGAGVSLCHQCAGECEDPGITKITADHELPDGGFESVEREV